MRPPSPNAPPAGSIPSTAAAEPWISVEQAAAHLGVKKISVYRWIETRGLPARKIGKLWKLKLSDVDAWVREHAEATASVPRTKSRDSLPAFGRSATTTDKSPVVLVIDDDELVRDN